MVSAQRQSDTYSPAEYLALERASTARHEYLDGFVYAFAGGSPEHSAIAANIIASLVAQLHDRPCQAFTSDLKVATGPDDLFSYPDASVVCGELQFYDAERDVITNPSVVVEVLSPTTEAYDRGREFAKYQHLVSLTDYVLVAQDTARVEHYVRQPGNRWLLTTVEGLEGAAHIASIECTLRLADVYHKVTLSPS
jgi:Uma2 family endonuclease